MVRLAPLVLVAACERPRDHVRIPTTADTVATVLEWPYAPVDVDAEEPVLGETKNVRIEPVPEGASVQLFRAEAMTNLGCAHAAMACLVDPEPVGEPLVGDAAAMVAFPLATETDERPRAVYYQAEITGPEPGDVTLSEVVARDVSVDPASAAVSLRDVTDFSGLPSMFTFGNTHTGGVAWLDYNGDHWPDLFVTNGGGFQHRLFRNDGGHTFTPVDGLGKPNPGVEDAGACFADIDNDGDADLFVPVDNPLPYAPFDEAPFEGGPNFLYVNQGDGTFVEEAALRGVVDPRGWRNISCSFADFDADGWVDLYVGNWAVNHPETEPRYGRLLVNDGTGHFVDAGVELDGRDALVTFAFDAELDGWDDLYVGHINPVHGFVGSNPWSDDAYFRNDHGTLVSAMGESPGVGDDAWAAMGIDAGDVENDGDLDLYVTDRWDIEDPLPRGNPLYLNRGDGTFADNSCDVAGVCTGHTGWPASFADFDGDGWIDLFVGTSRTQSLDLVYVNRQDGTFASHLVPDLQGRPTRGGSTADFDGDGRIDLAIWTQGEPWALLRNDSPAPHHWLEVELVGRTSNRMAVGAVVRVVTDTVSQLRRVSGGDSAHSQASNVVHFGLGGHDAAVDLEVLWPGGAVQQVADVPIDRFVMVDEVSGIVREELVEGSATWSADGTLTVAARTNYGGRTALTTVNGALAWDPDAQAFTGSFAAPAAPVEIELDGGYSRSWVLPVTVIE